MSKRNDYLSAIEAAILIKHECKPVHRETVYVHEKAGDETVWRGNVEVFDLEGHKEAERCYAWLFNEKDGGIKIFAVLQNGLIDSANRAVQAAIFADAQPPTPPHVIVKAITRHQTRGLRKNHFY